MKKTIKISIGVGLILLFIFGIGLYTSGLFIKSDAINSFDSRWKTTECLSYRVYSQYASSEHIWFSVEFKNGCQTEILIQDVKVNNKENKAMPVSQTTISDIVPVRAFNLPAQHSIVKDYTLYNTKPSEFSLKIEHYTKDEN